VWIPGIEFALGNSLLGASSMQSPTSPGSIKGALWTVGLETSAEDAYCTLHPHPNPTCAPANPEPTRSPAVA
jgi:hypothetical protein